VKLSDQFVAGVMDISPLRVVNAILAMFFQLPQELWVQHRWSMIAAILPGLAVWAIVGGAISRSAAEDYLSLERKPWTHYVAFAIRKSISLVLAFVGPLFMIGVLCGALVVAGLTLRVPGVQVLGALLLPVGVLLAMAALVVMCGLSFGFPMLGPAVVCEGTDSIDAVQRVLAYVVGRPFRMATYVAIFVVLLVVCGGVFAVLTQKSLEMTASLCVQLAGDSTGPLIKYTIPEGASLKTTLSVVGFWGKAWKLLIPAYFVSLFHSAGTLMYLAARLVNDGQEPGELWQGSAVPAVLRRAEADADAASAHREKDEV
jgi:hypothetical protein